MPTDNLMLAGAQDAYEAQHQTVSAASIEYEIVEQQLKLSTADLIEEVYAAEKQFRAAVNSNEPATIGAVVLAAQRALCERRAMEALYDRPFVLPKTEEACRDALAVAYTKAQARRFTGEAVTGFGSLV